MKEKENFLFKNVKTPEEAIRLAKKYGHILEVKNNRELDELELENVSGGGTYLKETHASYSVVVRDKNTGEILCVVPY